MNSSRNHSSPCSILIDDDDQSDNEVTMKCPTRPGQQHKRKADQLVSFACAGFRPEVPSPFVANWPMMYTVRHPMAPFNVNSNGTIHHKSCSNHVSTKDESCLRCQSLADNHHVKGIVERALKPHNELSKTNHSYLTYSQLTQRCNDLRDKLTYQRLSSLNANRHAQHLNNQQSLSNTIINYIASHRIPRVSHLLACCLKAKRSPQYIFSQVCIKSFITSYVYF